ncbi:GNAT family N-acetyltransferase [bacterium]|nr:GNAT family N-acetyltransferase [bacterium]
MKIGQKRIEAQGIRFFINIDGKEMARAFLYLLRNDQHKRPFGFVEDVFVGEELRGQGVGTKIMEEIIKTVKEENCYKLILTSRYSKPKVHELYQKLGFKDWGKEFRINF